jgi:hypothetical protein
MPCTPQNRAVSVRLAAVCTTVGLLLGSALVAAPALAQQAQALGAAVVQLATSLKLAASGLLDPLQAAQQTLCSAVGTIESCVSSFNLLFPA